VQRGLPNHCWAGPSKDSFQLIEPGHQEPASIHPGVLKHVRIHADLSHGESRASADLQGHPNDLNPPLQLIAAPTTLLLMDSMVPLFSPLANILHDRAQSTSSTPQN
jgi:hypothetical protein